MITCIFNICLLAAVLSLNCRAARIISLDIPLIVKNGTGPVDFICTYHVRENENGLVIKWYHDLEQIYQWIPPMPPRDIGIFEGLTEYPEENLKRPNSHSIIRLKRVNLEMHGEYTCSVSTYQEDAARTGLMTVYVPETSAAILASNFNKTHINLTCITKGARPPPILRIYIDGKEINADRGYHEDPSWIDLRRAIIREPIIPTIIECEIILPGTDYRRRERLIYYPGKYFHQSTGNQSRSVSSMAFSILSLLIIWMHN